jgi:type I restriction enzyme M protein
MPLTPDMRRSIDQIRDYLFGGGYPDPVSNAEQLSFLFSFYLVEGIDAENRARARFLKKPYTSLFDGTWELKNPLNAAAGLAAQDARGASTTALGTASTIPRERFRWSIWAKGLSGESLVRFVRDEVFAFFAELGQGAATNFMAGARLTIDEPTVLTQVINLVDGLRLDQADADTKGDLFEHVLRQIKQAGELGQFRTPRHVIRTIVEMIDPRVGETIYDSAAGTAGFLVAAYNHMRLANSSPSAIVTSRAGRQAAAARPGRQALGGTGQRAEQRHFLRQRRGPEDGAAEQLHLHAHSDQQRQGKDARSLKVTITLAWQRMAAARTCRSPGSGRARPSIKISCPVTSPSGIA